jgi:tetratricopeptide (TPR) repeat protein
MTEPAARLAHLTPSSQHEGKPSAAGLAAKQARGSPGAGLVDDAVAHGSSLGEDLRGFCLRGLASLQNAAGGVVLGRGYRSWRHEEAQGRALIRDGQLARGVARLLAAATHLRASPKHATTAALLRVETCLERAEARLEAHYSQSIAENPQDLVSHQGRAELRQRAGDSEGALADYDQALAISPNHLRLRLDRGVARHRRGGGNLAGAVSDFDDILAREPKNATARFNRAFCLALQDPERALEDMAAAQSFGTWPGEWFPAELRAWVLNAGAEDLARAVTFL